jgi:hypothetical protein
MATVRKRKGVDLEIVYRDITELKLDPQNSRNHPPQQIAIEIGATADEVELLRQEGVFKAKGIDKHEFGRAWYPKETRNG